MKTIRTRLYTVIPRSSSSVGLLSASPPKSATSLRRGRSGSSTGRSDNRALYTNAGSSTLPLHYFDSGSPPSSLPTPRPSNPHAAPTRWLQQPGDSQTHSTHGTNTTPKSNPSPDSAYPPASQGQLSSSLAASVALNSSAHDSPSVVRPYSNFPAFPGQQWCTSSSGTYSATLDGDQQKLKTQVRKYQLDVGAYGIPKHRRNKITTTNSDQLSLAIQVGEDAYFIRDDAMGVADGVGGWNKVSSTESHYSEANGADIAVNSSGSTDNKRREASTPSACKYSKPSPSALFARMLMHFCSFEVDQVTHACPYMHSPSPPSHLTPLLPGPLYPWLPHPMLPVSRKSRSTKPTVSVWDNCGTSNSSSHLVDMMNVGEVDHEHRLLAGEGHELRRDIIEINPVEILEKAYRSAMSMHSASTSSYYGPDFPRKTVIDATHQHTDSRPTGSSTALLAVLSGETLRIAHLGDCIGLLIRDGEIVWKSEEMWWGFNCPLQLGPLSRTQPSDARSYEVDVQEEDILILASDGMSDNLWEEDILDEVKRFSELSLFAGGYSGISDCGEGNGGMLRRRAMAGMLSEALCSRAKFMCDDAHPSKVMPRSPTGVFEDCDSPLQHGRIPSCGVVENDEVPFARRAREEGRYFRGGKSDDISVLVAIISLANT